METIVATDTAPKIFLTDYASYNNGTQFQFGHWVNLTDFNDEIELMEYIREHFEKCDKQSPLDSPREEIMITDYEFFPEVLYSESMSEKDFEKIYKLMEWQEEQGLESLENENDNLLSVWNEFCDVQYRGENKVFAFNDEFFELYLPSDNFDAFKLGVNSRINWSDDYATFNGYGNIETLTNPSREIDETVLIPWIIENL